MSNEPVAPTVTSPGFPGKVIETDVNPPQPAGHVEPNPQPIVAPQPTAQTEEGGVAPEVNQLRTQAMDMVNAQRAEIIKLILAKGEWNPEVKAWRELQHYALGLNDKVPAALAALNPNAPTGAAAQQHNAAMENLDPGYQPATKSELDLIKTHAGYIGLHPETGEKLVTISEFLGLNPISARTMAERAAAMQRQGVDPLGHASLEEGQEFINYLVAKAYNNNQAAFETDIRLCAAYIVAKQGVGALEAIDKSMPRLFYAPNVLRVVSGLARVMGLSPYKWPSE